MSDQAHIITLRRRRESITAEEVIRIIADRTKTAYSAERIFALGLIEQAINEIING